MVTEDQYWRLCLQRGAGSRIMNYYKVFTSLSLLLIGVFFVLLLSNSSVIHHMSIIQAWIGELSTYRVYITAITHNKLRNLCVYSVYIMIVCSLACLPVCRLYLVFVFYSLASWWIVINIIKVRLDLTLTLLTGMHCSAWYRPMYDC